MPAESKQQSPTHVPCFRAYVEALHKSPLLGMIHKVSRGALRVIQDVDGAFGLVSGFRQDKERVLHPKEDYSGSLDTKRGTKPPLCGRFAQSLRIYCRIITDYSD